MLLGAGADVHAKDALGKTALMYAARDAEYGCVKHLIDNGANVNDASYGGTIAMGYFIMGHSWERHGNRWRKYFLRGLSSLSDYASLPSLPPSQQAVARLLLKEGSWMNTIYWGPVDIYLPTQLYDTLNAAGQNMSKFRRPVDLVVHEDDEKEATDKYQPRDLMQLCTNAIRTHMLQVDARANLFLRVPEIGLPTALARFILHNEELL